GGVAAFRAFADAEIAWGDALSRPDAGERLAEAIADLLAPLASGAWSPAVYRVDDRPVAFAAIRLRYLERVAAEEPAATMSEAIVRFLAESGQAAPARHGQRRERLVSQIRGARERVAARLRSLTEERERAEAGERWREMGELIYAYLAQIAPGQTALDVDGYHIPLDPALTPSENAQAYFERYRKARSATATLPERIEETRTELAYLEQLETLAGLAEGIDEIEQIQREWEAYAGARAGAPGKGKREPAPKRPRPYRTPRGDLIYVGHNGRQNDLVTFDIAAPDDTWLHARDLPGAHVVVHWAGPEDEDLLERAASLAAYYSAGRSSTRVEVDIAPRRYVRKIKGAGPGMVTYRNERTVSVRPASPEALGLA
ncbi:MAG: DUF814 domain-containing protein, partial [Thermomicrobiaceae bacterium]|nr:DUF814 domain-containing protein [Thermomicrobiaceae bacterium]